MSANLIDHRVGDAAPGFELVLLSTLRVPPT
jgi:hypothetical protein